MLDWHSQATDDLFARDFLPYFPFPPDNEQKD
jgi:hypothetical protein